MHDFSHALSKLRVIARNCDWFIALFAPVVIGGSNNNYYCFGFGFQQSFENHSKVQCNTFCCSQEHEFIKGDGTATTFDTESWIKPILAEVDEHTS